MKTCLGALAALLLTVTVAGCGESDTDDEPRAAAASPQATVTADPGSTAGACSILAGKGGAVDRAMSFPRATESADDETERRQVQDELFSVVVGGNEHLADPAGQLVDFLDDPNEYVDGGEVSKTVTNASSDIERICADR